MRILPKLSICVVVCAFLLSCSQALKPASSLVQHPLSKTDEFLPFDGVWINPKVEDYNNRHSGCIYVAPVDVSLIEKKYPKEAKLMQKSFHEALEREVYKALQVNRARDKGKEWKLSAVPTPRCLKFEFAITKLKPTKGYLNVIGFIGGFFSPIPGTGSVVSKFASGGICLEGRVVDEGSNATLMCFQDCSDDPMTLFSSGDFGKFGHSEDALDIWAREIGATISTPVGQKVKKIRPSLISLKKIR